MGSRMRSVIALPQPPDPGCLRAGPQQVLEGAPALDGTFSTLCPQQGAP